MLDLLIKLLEDTNKASEELNKDMKKETERLDKHMQLLEDIIEEEEW